MDPATESAGRVRGATVGWDTRLVPGPDRLFAVLGDATRLRRISASSHRFIRVSKVGAAGAKVWREHFAVSGRPLPRNAQVQLDVAFAGSALTHRFSTVAPKPRRRRH